jgi:hypothetical protein
MRGYSITCPIASILYGPSLVAIVVFVAKCLERLPFSRKLTSVDPYDIDRDKLLQATCLARLRKAGVRQLF